MRSKNHLPFWNFECSYKIFLLVIIILVASTEGVLKSKQWEQDSSSVGRSRQTRAFWRENQCQLTTQDIFTRIMHQLKDIVSFWVLTVAVIVWSIVYFKENKEFWFQKKIFLKSYLLPKTQMWGEYRKQIQCYVCMYVVK